MKARLLIIALIMHVVFDIALVLGLWALLVGCATAVSSTPPPEEVYKPWAEAQEQITRQYPDAGDPYTVRPEMFVWDVRSKPFPCGQWTEPIIYGCFQAPKIIYVQGNAGAIWHEAGHAILWALNYPKWKCSFIGHAVQYPQLCGS